MDAKQLNELADNLFSKRSSLLSLWQDVAENFYPERAEFTTSRTLGTDFAAGLMSGYPALTRRTLGDQLGTMLRPTQKQWNKMVVNDPSRETLDGKKWLEWATNVMRRAMYDKRTQFTRATKEGDHDFACFGQCAISIEMNRNKDALLYRNWHLRDVAWQENAEGRVGSVFRKWKAQARVLTQMFKCHQGVIDTAAKAPFDEVTVKHMVVESDMYDMKHGFPYTSIYYDADHDFVMEAVPSHSLIYIVPRWQTVSGSQYAYSPATVIALPDARLIQAMTMTLLEAGEMAVKPPLIAQKDVIRSDVSVYAGGITIVDRDYDERLGEAIRPLQLETKGIPLGMGMVGESRKIIHEAFFLNRLALPPSEREVTAYEMAQRVQEYIRNAIPIFEPMEMEYNGELCEASFDLLLRHGAFGSPYDMPQELRGANFDFVFQSPLHDAIEQQKAGQFLQSKALIADAIAIDPSAAMVVDAKEALRDALEATIPVSWIRSKEEIERKERAQADAQRTQMMLANMQQGSEVAVNIGKAAKDMSMAGA